MMDFPRNRKPILALQLTPLIDVTFILIIFFMLTTSFMKMESMEVLLPAASGTAVKRIADVNMAHIYLQSDGRIAYGQQPVDKVDLSKTLQAVFRSYPDQRVVVLVAKAVSLQTLVDIMDMVYSAGGKNVFVREWEQTAPAPTPALTNGSAR